MNIGNLYEQYFNFTSRHVKHLVMDAVKEAGADIETLTDSVVDKIFQLPMGLLEILDTEQYYSYQQATYQEKREILEEIVTEELYLYYKVTSKVRPYQAVLDIENSKYRPPTTNISWENEGKIVTTNEEIVIAPQYVILLAKTADNFLSTASAKTNHYGLPIGVSSKARVNLPYRNSPVRILSETETRLYASYVGRKGLIELKDRANSVDTHKAVYRNILTAPCPTNIVEVIDRDIVPYGKDTALEFISNIMKPAGLDLEYVKDKTKLHPVIK